MNGLNTEKRQVILQIVAAPHANNCKMEGSDEASHIIPNLNMSRFNVRRE